MKAVVFKGVGKIALEEVADPQIKDPKDVIVRLTRSAICGTDLHFVRGTIPGIKGKGLFSRGTILGHEGVGIIEAVGAEVKKFTIGDRVIVPSTIGCGECDYCRDEIYSQCDNANPMGPDAGTVFFGGPAMNGNLDGMQAEKVRVPFADASLFLIPHDISDDQAILVSDILPTAYMAVEMADVEPEDTVAVFGCGPVGQLAIACLNMIGPRIIYAIDQVPSRLHKAKEQGAYPINFSEVDPAKELNKLTNGRGPTKVIDAVGVDADQMPCSIFNCLRNFIGRRKFKKERKFVAPYTNIQHGNWIPGNAPSQALRWAVRAVAKAGTVSIIGVYPPTVDFFPIGEAMNKNLILRMGNCNHHAYIPHLFKWIQRGEFDPLPFITHKLAFNDAIEAYKHFDKRDEGWVKVVLEL